MIMSFDASSVADYERFLAVKRLPKYKIIGASAIFPDEYASMLGLAKGKRKAKQAALSDFLMDYQRDIAAMAIAKKRFAVFADCGLGKTLIMTEVARHAAAHTGKRVLLVSPLMVVSQTAAEWKRWYKDDTLQIVNAAGLAEWLRTGEGVAITNYEAITDDLPTGDLGGLILDESSMLKSHYGAWGTRLIEMGRGVEYKLALTGTPAPNDRIEYANHAVFCDAFPTVNSFLARFFVNRGETNERWELKAHALKPFYTAMSHWCIFLTNPSTYGWKDNCNTIPPIHIHVENVPTTDAQRQAFMAKTGDMFVNQTGGIGSRSAIARIGKGWIGDVRVESNKTGYVAKLVESWPDESTIVWCKFNNEQDDIANALPGCGNITGATPIEERHRIIDAFKRREIRVLVTKPKILGFGLNLQVATRHVFAGLQDSYEEFYQAVKRSNRIGSKVPLSVHIPVTEFEAPMIETVLAKAKRVDQDTRQQEEMFRDFAKSRL
jgi:superfamily II DNA or RNA helicase